MAKKLAQAQEIPPPAPKAWAIEPVTEGGNVRRIHFAASEAPPPAAAAEPVPARPAPQAAALVEFKERYHPRTAHDSLDAIHSGVDHIHVERAAGSALPARERTLYETPGGAVREAVVPTSEGSRRLLFVSRRKGGREEEERFTEARVDRIVKDVRLEEEEVVRETVAPVAEAPAAPPAEPGAPAAKPKRFLGLFGRRRTEDAGTQDYIPVEPGLPDTPPEPAPVAPVVEAAPAWTPPETELLPAAEPAPARLPTARKASRPRRAKPAKARRTAADRRKAKAPAPYVDYRGDQHLVIELEGIGPTYAKRLQDAGVHTTDRLCYESAGRLAKRIRAPAKTVRTWQSMAQLVKVKGIGPQFAEALARAGVDGIDGLKAGTPKALAAKVERYLAGLETNVIGTAITAKRIQGWQRRAARMRKVRQPAPPTTAPEATTWYEKARQDAAAREQKAGLKAKRSAARRAKGRRKAR